MRNLFLFVFMSIVSVSYSQEYKVGEKVEVDLEGIWFDAYIIELDGKKVKLNYDGTSDETDFWTKIERIRKPQNKGGGSVKIIEMNTGAMAPDKTDPKDKKTKNVHIPKLVKVTLHNTCGHREELVVGETTHTIDGNKKLELEVLTGTLVYSVDAGKKVMKGKVTQNLRLFYPNCE